MVSINTNLGAYNAQQSLSTASAAVTSSTYRLSSGNRIAQAKDDVAGLSVGTILATGVNTLKTALQNAGQASSLLQVADGAAKNITDLLQRNKALAVQSTSGTLSNNERGYLKQEFDSNTKEIDRIVQNTKFSSVTLLDGSLTSQATAVTNTNVGAAAATQVSQTTVAAFTLAPTAGQKMTFNGVEVIFANATDVVGSAAAAGKVVAGAAISQTAANVVRYLNSCGDARLSNMYFYANAVAGRIDVEWGGGKMDGAISVTAAPVGTVTGFAAATTATIAASANAVDGLSRARTFVVGNVGGSILANGDTAATGAGEAITFSNGAVATIGVDRTGDWLGKIGGDKIGKFEFSYNNTTDTVVGTIKVGNITYTSPATDITTAGAITQMIFTGADQSNNAYGGKFALNFKGTALTSVITSQQDANVYADQVNASFADVTFVQNRDIKSFAEGAIATNSGGVQVGVLDGMSANFRSDNFNDVQIGGIKIETPGAGESDAKISLTINGEQYVSYAGVGKKVGINTIIGLQNVNDPNKCFTFVTSNTAIAGQAGIALDLSTQDNADAVANALSDAFGVQDGHATLNFQIGSVASDSIGVTVKSASSNSLYQGKTLDIGTANGANAASAVLDTAIQYITSLRADIGAFQARFSAAASNLSTSIQNQDAARATFLDADIATESTSFAQSQVKLQASISVLAQANQLPQNLLKLLG